MFSISAFLTEKETANETHKKLLSGNIAGNRVADSEQFTADHTFQNVVKILEKRVRIFVWKVNII